MSSSVDVNISIDELYRRVLENKRRLIGYVENLLEVYDKVNSADNLPENSERVVIDIPNSFPIILYKSPSRRAYQELFSKALLFLKLEYAIYETLESRLGKLKGYDLRAMVRYFSDVPTTIVIMLSNDNTIPRFPQEPGNRVLRAEKHI